MSAPAGHHHNDPRDSRPQRPNLRAVTGDDLATAPVWWARLAHRDRVPVEHSLVAVGSARFPHGTAVDLTTMDPHGRRPTGWLVDVRYRAVDGRIVQLTCSPGLADPGLPLWFAEISHATSDVPSTSLVAFTGDICPEGTLVTPREVCAQGLPMTANVGELRWWTRSGLVETLTAAPEMEGRGIERVLLALAGGIATLRNWPPLVRSVHLPTLIDHEGDDGF
jgi:hypothetical protein